jgi:hypothetical protein
MKTTQFTKRYVWGCSLQAKRLIRQGILQCYELLTRIFRGVLSFILIGIANRGEPCDRREMIGDKLHINKNNLRPGAARSKAWICGRLIVGIVGSISSGDMDVCHLRVLCFVRGFCDGPTTPFQRSPTECVSVCVCHCVWSSTPRAFCIYNE